MQAFSFHPGEARIAELVHAYLLADYRWELDRHWLNLQIGRPAPDLVARFPQARHFGLISAWDPHSVPRSEQANRDADQALQNDLLASGAIFRAAFSSATNRTWREPSWLVVDLPVDSFDALAARYGQLGTLYWAAGTDVRMRIYAARPASFESQPALDWLGADAKSRANPAV